jgi:hypothetical protein
MSAEPGATVETAVDELMNGLVSYGRPATIVLDDLQAVDAVDHTRDRAVAVERAGAGKARSDPPIGVGRVRARRTPTRSARAICHSFTIDEASELLMRE